MERTLVGLMVALVMVGCSGSSNEHSACGKEDAGVCAIEHWQAGLGAGSKTDPGSCAETVMASTVRQVAQADVGIVCGHPNLSLLGCVKRYDAAGAEIIVADSSDVDTVAHEMLHVLLQCVSGDPDEGHRKSVWGDLKGEGN